jgi:hypothetical protein
MRSSQRELFVEKSSSVKPNRSLVGWLNIQEQRSGLQRATGYGMTSRMILASIRLAEDEAGELAASVAGVTKAGPAGSLCKGFFARKGLMLSRVIKKKWG